MIDGKTSVYSLYGQPVSHSLSPLIFNSTFEKQGLNAAYLAFEVDPRRLENAVDAARSLDFHGFNVTMPHKTAIIPFLDKVNPTAEKIGAVNTVVGHGTELEGYNTDGEGALRAIRAFGIELRGQKIVVIGAGGASRAVAHRLAEEAEEIRVLDRDPGKARDVAGISVAAAKTLHASLSRTTLEQNLKDAYLVINATPVQTSRLIETLGLPKASLPDDLWIFDLAYDKPSDESIRNRRIHPLEMLVQQAALSYELWFGKPAPLELMRSSLVDHNGADWK